MQSKLDFDELMKRRRQRTDAGDVFESTVARSTADSSSFHQKEGNSTGYSVFTKPAHPGKSDASYAVQVPACQSPATYEKLPAMSIADANSKVQIPGQQSSSVFERPPSRSTADASHSMASAETQAFFHNEIGQTAASQKTTLRGSKSVTISPRVAALARHIEDGIQNSSAASAAAIAVRPRRRVQPAREDRPEQQQHVDVADAMDAEATATTAELPTTMAKSRKRTVNEMEESGMEAAKTVELPEASQAEKSRKRTADEMEETACESHECTASEIEESHADEPARKRQRTSAWSMVGSSLSSVGSGLRGMVKALGCAHRSEPAAKPAAHR